MTRCRPPGIKGPIAIRREFDFERKILGAPWVERPDELYATTVAEDLRRLRAMQPGVIAREGTGSAFPGACTFSDRH